MNECRTGASSVLYQGHMIVIWGRDGMKSLDSVEELNLAQQDGHWVKSQLKLPLELDNHVCVVYQNRLLAIGGNHHIMSIQNSIYEFQLTCLYTSKLLATMPREVEGHSVEIVNNKIYIFGGSTSMYLNSSINNVLMFDPATNNQ